MKPGDRTPAMLVGAALLTFAAALALVVPVLFIPAGLMAAIAAVIWALRHPR